MPSVRIIRASEHSLPRTTTALLNPLKIDFIKGRSMGWPRLETDEYLMSTGSERLLEDAFRITYKDLVMWFVEDYGMEMMDAYQLCSQVGEADIAQVVDPSYTVVAKVAKKHLPEGQAFGGKHQAMKVNN